MNMYVVTKNLWQRGGYAAVLLVLCVNVTQVNAADTDLGDALSKAQRRGVSVLVYIYDSI